MRRFVRTIMGLLLTVSFIGIFLLITAPASRASFTSSCSKLQYSDTNVRRLDAQAYAAVADKEGYEWGGGCWNDNNVDDTPGQPDSGGEGPDCSGLVFKVWELRNTPSDAGFTWYQGMQNVHGVFSSYDFHSPVSSDPFFKLASKDSMMYMDAYAKDGHVALLWTGVSPTSGSSYVLEALGDAYGVLVAYEGYKGDSNYVGVQRKGWTPDCWPLCKGQEQARVVVP